MKRFLLLKLIPFMFSLVLLSGCSITNHTMKNPNYHIEMYKTDFEYSPQITAEATSVRILGIDWTRLFVWKTGTIDVDRFNESQNNVSISSSLIADPVIGSLSIPIVPVLGNYGKGKVSSYALYNLMKNNPGYDIVIYPQYETKQFIIPIFYSKRKVTVTARLGKIKE